MNATGGFVKLIADEEHGEFLGAHVIGHDVSELLSELTLAQQYRKALAAFDAACLARLNGKAFVALSDEQKDEVIRYRPED